MPEISKCCHYFLYNPCMCVYIYIYIIMSVLPKGRYFSANAGISSSVQSRSSTANSGTKVAVLLGINRCSSFILLSAPTLSLACEQTLKDSRGYNMEVSRVDLANWALQTSSKFITGVKYQFHQGF